INAQSATGPAFLGLALNLDSLGWGDFELLEIEGGKIAKRTSSLPGLTRFTPLAIVPLDFDELAGLSRLALFRIALGPGSLLRLDVRSLDRRYLVESGDVSIYGRAAKSSTGAGQAVAVITDLHPGGWTQSVSGNSVDIRNSGAGEAEVLLLDRLSIPP